VEHGGLFQARQAAVGGVGRVGLLLGLLCGHGGILAPMRKDATNFCRSMLALLATASPALAQDDLRPEPREPLRFVQTPWGQQSDAEVDTAPSYGEENFASWVLSYSAAFDGEALDQGLTLAYSRFLVDDIEAFVEGGLWSFYDQGSNAAYGLSLGFGFRWHFLTREKWTMFADMGIAVLGTTDAVPVDGTEFNFMPRVGIGFTRELDENVRFIGGLRWHHISNARTRGDSRNPARDAPLLYAGLVFPF
jgi:hypothetical protein